MVRAKGGFETMRKFILCLLFAFSAYANSNQVELHSFSSTSTNEQMCGFNGTITPNGSGEIAIVVSGSAYVQDAGNNCFLNIRYGTGTPPKAGDAVTGTVIGAKQVAVGNAAAASIGFTLNAIVPNRLEKGKTYWFDVGMSTQGDFSQIGTCSMSIVELAETQGLVMIAHGSSAPFNRKFIGTTAVSLMLGNKRKKMLFDIYE